MNNEMKFESVEALISYADHNNPNIEQPLSKEVSDFRTEFTGCKDWQEALKFAREGKDVTRIDGALREVTKGQIVETAMMSVAGAYVDIGSYLGGEPECMVTFQQEENPKFATIVVDICERAGTDTMYFTNKAITVCYLVDTLQNNGFRVQVIGVIGDDLRGKVECMQVVIKRYEQPLSLAQISGCIISSFFRRIGFGWIERVFYEKHGGQAHTIAYGRIDRFYSESFKKNTDHIVIESHTIGDWDRNKEGMVKKCNEIIKQLNDKY